MLLLVLLGPAWLKNVLVENLAWCSHHQDDQVGLDYVIKFVILEKMQPGVLVSL